MNEEQIFAKALEALCRQAREQGNAVSERQLEEAFEKNGLSLSGEQLLLVRDYLKEKKIGVGEPGDPDSFLSEEEVRYLDLYLEELEGLQTLTEGEKEAVTLSAMAGESGAREKLIEIFLPRVAEIARLYAGQGIGMEDLIGEGNVALAMAAEMVSCAGSVQEAQGNLVSAVMEAMEELIARDAGEKKTGEKLVKKANDVLDKAREMAQDLGRKVTVEELAKESGLSRDRIREAVRITGDRIEYLDTKEGF